MPKVGSSSRYLVVVEADFGFALDSTDQVGIWKLDSEFCPNEYNQNSFNVISVGHSQVELKILTPQFQTSEYNLPGVIDVLNSKKISCILTKARNLSILELVNSKTNFGMKLLPLMTTFSIRLINFEQTLPR